MVSAAADNTANKAITASEARSFLPGFLNFTGILPFLRKPRAGKAHHSATVGTWCVRDVDSGL
jgi:hypothetical protein